MQKSAIDDQLALSFNHTDSSLKQYLEECLNRPVAIVLTGNSTTMLSARIHDNVLRIRLHRMFLAADGRVVNEIVSYLKNRRVAMPHFRSFIRANRAPLGLKPPKKIPVRSVGRYCNLNGLYDEINREYFGGAISAVITWGSRSPRYAVRKRTVGSYSERSNMIRINPVLDRKTVPRYYIAFIIYHEMLHAAMGTAIRGNRRSVHSPEFRKREKLFKDYEKVQAWQGGKT
jgi:hypothetical protein